MSEPTEAEKLAAALTEIERLQGRVWILKNECDSLRSALEREQEFSKTVGAENTELRNRILRVSSTAGPMGTETLYVAFDVQRFFSFKGPERDEFVRDAVIDGIHKLLRAASREAHLETLRKKVGA